MARLCIYWLLLAAFAPPAFAVDREDAINAIMVATRPTARGPSTKDAQISALKQQVGEQEKKIDRLLDELVKERKAREAVQPQYRTETKYRTETRTVWEYCPTCPGQYAWQQKTVKVRVPYKAQVRIETKAVKGAPAPGYYRDSATGRRYFWNGRDSYWVDENPQSSFTQPRGGRGQTGTRSPSARSATTGRSQVQQRSGSRWQATSRYSRSGSSSAARVYYSAGLGSRWTWPGDLREHLLTSSHHRGARQRYGTEYIRAATTRQLIAVHDWDHDSQ